MIDWIYIAIASCGFVSVLTAIWLLRIKKRSKNTEFYKQILEFTDVVNDELVKDEELLEVCGVKPCVAITNKRLFIDAKDEISVIPFRSVNEVKYSMLDSKSSSRLEKVMKLIIIADSSDSVEKHTIYRDLGNFDNFVLCLNEMTRSVTAK